MEKPYDSQQKLKILILYDQNSCHTNTVREYLNSFSLFSEYDIFFCAGSELKKSYINTDFFDVVVFHYSIRLIFKQNPHTLTSVNQLKRFGGLKVLFIQDEYDNTEVARTWIKTLGIKVVFTCVPQPYIQKVYPQECFSNVTFINVLTGYVPSALVNSNHNKPLEARRTLIGYRGRRLHYRYGRLAYEKYIIGAEIKKICMQRGLPVDIETEDEKRIYGEQWYQFLGNCRATLGTESGCNIFDFDGNLERKLEAELKEKPNIVFEEFHQKHLASLENDIKMNQISPKIFEAAALNTALILFEGEYSGIVKSDYHYISLKKDFSNVDEVLAKLQNDAFVKRMTRRTYVDLIESGIYSYANFINLFDVALKKYAKKISKIKFVPDTVVCEVAVGSQRYHIQTPGVTNVPLEKEWSKEQRIIGIVINRKEFFKLFTWHNCYRLFRFILLVFMKRSIKLIAFFIPRSMKLKVIQYLGSRFSRLLQSSKKGIKICLIFDW